MNTSTIVTDISLAPLLPLWLILAAAAVLLAILLGCLARRMPGTLWRSIAVAVLIVMLLNPAINSEQREALPDTVLVLVDDSHSQSAGDRLQQTEHARNAILERLSRLPNLDVRVTDVMHTSNDDLGPGAGTYIFSSLNESLVDVPRDSVSSIFLITDGRVHDVPPTLEETGIAAPVHVFVSGSRRDVDRYIEVIEAPQYGVVDRALPLVFRVQEDGNTSTPVPVTITRPGGRQVTVDVIPGRRFETRILLEHAGHSVVRLEAEALDGEVTVANNGATLMINGIRENLKVLLISGEVHTGIRNWRNTLKSDPSVELVHFTILRPAEKQDSTPNRELALIPFPVEELFELRLNEFDLIIFDRYRKRGVIPENYLENVVDFVTEGGAILIAAGPDFPTLLGLHATSLRDLLPALPTGSLMLEPFVPQPTERGARHPVISGLDGASMSPPPWGAWYRQVAATHQSGDVLLTGVDSFPLLAVQRWGDGRVAELLSDHIWLWSRGFGGSGPSTELLRRLAHWLMKEPDLEEESLVATSSGSRIRITRQSMSDVHQEAVVHAPSGESLTVSLEPVAPGRVQGEIVVDHSGHFEIFSDTLATAVRVGALNSPEWQDVRATTTLIEEFVNESGGAMHWIEDERLPTIRRVSPGHDTRGNDWVGILDHGRFAVVGIESDALLPPWIALVLLGGSLALAWRREGR